MINPYSDDLRPEVPRSGSLEGQPTQPTMKTKTNPMHPGYMYILLCSDQSYYTGSTIDLEKRLQQHQSGEGANYTKKRLPVKLVYYEYYHHVYLAYNREKQIQKWSRRKKEALVKGEHNDLPELAKSYRFL